MEHTPFYIAPMAIRCIDFKPSKIWIPNTHTAHGNHLNGNCYVNKLPTYSISSREKKMSQPHFTLTPRIRAYTYRHMLGYMIPKYTKFDINKYMRFFSDSVFKRLSPCLHMYIYAFIKNIIATLLIYLHRIFTLYCQK